MRITLLGTGTPIVEGMSCASSILVETGATRIVVDAGRGVVTQLIAAGAHPREIDVVLITHHHHDHISSLGELLMTAWHNGRTAPLHVYGPSGTRAVVTALFEHVFARDIAFARFTEPDMPRIEDVVLAHDVTAGVVAGSISAQFVDHGHSLGISRDDWPCLGYRIEADDRVLAISGDAVSCSGLDALARDAEVLVQCCYLAEAEITTPAFRQLADHVIACSGEAGKIAARNHAKRLVLTHIRPKSDAMMQALLDDVRRDFGEVVIGRELMVIEI